ncbi:hypothetical protein MAR_013543 [Mya arenaria]|uniref:Uncharacterized protein n=1 Tax=Mya arenaria TaxID=6604 RepID=A0ABY7G2T8_MYAAR|nr:hypothetical protein MAR_013543 [Mya arenaria]
MSYDIKAYHRQNIQDFLVEEIKFRIVQNRGRSRQRTALEVVSGKVMKKYRLRAKSSCALGVKRGQLQKADMGKAFYRPRYAKLVKYSARKTCFCHKHQSIALKVKGLKTVCTITTEYPDQVIWQYSDDEIVGKIINCNTDAIKFVQWKRKEVEHKGRLTKRMLIAQEEMPKLEFVEIFKQDLIEFRSHTSRVKTLFEQSDYRQHTQFAKWISPSIILAVTLMKFKRHTLINVLSHYTRLLYTQKDQNLNHESFIYVSDTQSHNTGTVYASIKRITERLKIEHPGISYVHYITDWPTSLY